MATAEKQSAAKAGKHLLVVESPHKAQTIGKFLGKDFQVLSSMGHVRDLPPHDLGVDLDGGFGLTYEVTPGKAKTVGQLRGAAKAADVIYLASDPDREGEAIAWHLKELLASAAGKKPFLRVKYNEITPRAVKAAIAAPGDIDMNLVDAQQARRAIDRIVGYKVSPFVRRRVKGGTSAGRVQSVALRLVCEREAEIRAFNPVAYWVLGAMLEKEPAAPFFAKLVRINDKKAEIGTEEEARRIFAEMNSRRFVVESVNTREITRHALPPFITSSLQRAASSVLGMTPGRTMSIAQKLYEGVEVGDPGGPVGLITYMRTDGTFVAREAQEAALDYISANYGDAFRPDRPNLYRSGASAQEAHEAIRPTDVTRTPASLANYLEPQELKLYDLIWRRFVASQMTGAKFSQRTVIFDGARPDGAPLGKDEDVLTLSATTTDVVFQGFMKVMALDIKKAMAMPDGKDAEVQTDDDEDAQDAVMPPLTEGERLKTAQVKSTRKETKPPPRFSEASLIDTLEKNGIGRPSTYATIMETIIKHGYVVRERKTLSPTPLGEEVVSLLVEKFPALFEVGFTANLEEDLDKVADGSNKVGYVALMSDFYDKFRLWLEEGKDPPANVDDVKRVLDALVDVKEWAPAEKRGRRTYDDHRLATSLRLQFESGEKPISARQFTALLGIARRHRMQIADYDKRIGSLFPEDDNRSRNPETPKETYHKLEMLLTVPGISERRNAFLNSILSQLKSGRNLSVRQVAAVDEIFTASFADIPDGEALAAKYGIKVDASSTPPPDTETPALLKALADVKQWDPPAQRRGRTLDDKKFFESLRDQFQTKGALSVKQRSALRSMAKRYASQLPPGSLPSGE